MIETKRIIRRRRYRRSKFYLVWFALIGMICLMILGVSARRFLAVYYTDVVPVTPVLVEETARGEFIILRPETVVTAPYRGLRVREMEEGSRISKGAAAARLVYYEGSSLEDQREMDIPAPQSGILSFVRDGLEAAFDSERPLDFDFGKIMDFYRKKDEQPLRQAGNQDIMVEAGEMVFKVIDNLSPAYVCLETDRTDLPVPVIGTELALRLDNLPARTVQVADVQMERDHVYYLLTVSQGTEFPERRAYSGELVLESVEETALPAEVIVAREEQPGIYILKDGLIQWQPVYIIKQQGDQVVIDSLEEKTWVVFNPKWVWEGMQLRNRSAITRRE
ncbi:MAG: hypothetical protein LBL26_01420 [Peptococcaceae bacterium]|jgi:hypothetical protein|nr:hypothetical protein [Peptococcaceae bacterium]